MHATTAPIKDIRFDRETRDYSYWLNGEVVGFAATYFQAEQALNELVYSLLARPGSVADASDLAPDEAEAVLESQTLELAEIERQGGVAEAQPAQAFLPATAKGIAEAVAIARQAARTERTINAINRAYAELLIPGWMYTGDRLVVASRSRPHQRHEATAAGCTCEAWGLGAKLCWHRAAYIILATVTAPDRRA